MEINNADAAVAEPTIVCTIPPDKRIIVPQDVCALFGGEVKPPNVPKTEQMRQETLADIPGRVAALAGLSQAEKDALLVRLEAAIATPIADGGGVL